MPVSDLCRREGISSADERRSDREGEITKGPSLKDTAGVEDCPLDRLQVTIGLRKGREGVEGLKRVRSEGRIWNRPQREVENSRTYPYRKEVMSIAFNCKESLIY
jgi:hypothetical protein